MLNLDLEGAFRGKLPWSVEGWQEAEDWYHRLLQTPKDDWNLDEIGLTEDLLRMAVPPESLHLLEKLFDEGLFKGPRIGSPFAIRGNAFHPWNQLACFLMNRYPIGEWFFHFNRFMVIDDFLLDHRGDLKQDDLMRDSGEEHDEIRQETVQALCTLPFTKTYYLNGEERYTFDYNEVAAEARRLIDEAKDDKHKETS